MEECWFKGKPVKLEKQPLDCIDCKRLPKVIDKPEDLQLAAFIDGYRLAFLEIIIHLQPLTTDQENMIQGLERRFKCDIDRGIEIEQFRLPLEYVDRKRTS
jgi:hypothetical protein